MSYADSTIVETLTNKLIPSNDRSKYDALLSIAVDYSDNKIKNELIKNNVPIPTIPETIDPQDPANTLIKAANLYTAEFMFNTYYSDSDSLSPTSKQYRTDADTKLSNYIEIIHEGYNEETKEEEIPMPKFGSII